MDATTESSVESSREVMNEDWTAVVLGFCIIIWPVSRFIIPVPVYTWSNGGELWEKIFSGANLTSMLFQFLFISLMAVIGARLTGRSIRSFLLVFPLVYVITIVALILEGNGTIKGFNLEAVIFSLSLGLLIGNLFNLPAWFREVLSTELFVKIGLVLLGTRVIFTDILEAGMLGLVQSLVVVLSVWYFAFWLCKRFKLDPELTMMISSAVSICGVSAAIATAGAIKGDSKKLSYVISLVLIIAIPMMIFMPLLAGYMGLSQEVTGAWLGGSIDTTGAVVASGTLVGDTALKISTIVKFSQNVLLGLAAFAISIYWSWSGGKDKEAGVEKPTLRVIWDRFPKFVLGFVIASLIFSFIHIPGITDAVKASLKSIQTMWFVLAFTCIGLETRFSDLFNASNKKPLYAFVIAQLFNIGITLVVAYILFSGSIE